MVVKGTGAGMGTGMERGARGGVGACGVGGGGGGIVVGDVGVGVGVVGLDGSGDRVVSNRFWRIGASYIFRVDDVVDFAGRCQVEERERVASVSMYSLRSGVSISSYTKCVSEA